MSGIMILVDGATKILHLILMVFFLMAIGNSIWSWTVDTFDKRKSN